MRSELTRFPIVKSLLKNRWPQLFGFIVMLAGFLYAIMAGFLGTPVGNNNFGIVFVWIAWWAILILVVVPFFGRGWCAVCPLPMPGEWIQRGGMGTGMPYWGPIFENETIWSIIGYIYTFQFDEVQK